MHPPLRVDYKVATANVLTLTPKQSFGMEVPVRLGLLLVRLTQLCYFIAGLQDTRMVVNSECTIGCTVCLANLSELRAMGVACVSILDGSMQSTRVQQEKTRGVQT